MSFSAQSGVQIGGLVLRSPVVTRMAGHGANRLLEDNPATGSSPVAKDAYVETALNEWRRKALDFLITLSAIAYLPGIFLDVSGLGVPVTRSMQALLIVCYLVILAAAVFRRVDYHIRVWTLIGLSYGLAVIGSIAYNNGPFMRAFPLFRRHPGSPGMA